MKNLKISTELASAVLGKEVTKCSLLSTTRNSINITYFEDKEDFNTVWKEWNIYEFAFKCKEWAFKNKYKIQSQINASNKGHSHITKNNDDCWAKGFFENTEIEVIIKSCEFILTKKESK